MAARWLFRWTGLLALGLLISSAPARADALSDLRATLAGLQAGQPLHARLQAHGTVRSEDEPDPGQAKLQVDVHSDAGGLRLAYSAALLKRVADEAAAHARDSTRPTPLGNLIDQLTVGKLQPMVDFAPALLRMLDGATLTSQRQEAYQGQPARLLVFELPMAPKMDEEMNIKEFSDTVHVWLGRDGVPLAVRHEVKVHASKMFIGIQYATSADYGLQLVGKRLVAVTRHAEESHTVFGHGGSSTVDATLTPLPADAATPAQVAGTGRAG